MMLMELIYKISYKLHRGQIEIFMDRRHLIRCMLEEKTKVNQCMQDCSTCKCRVDEIRKELEIEIKISYSSKKVKEISPFE